ncbi:MAG: hypothetical protein HYV08_05825 [Deltaproteobacteria bacterium]|nr:hypothetical protein [Deltaproteobacteria bacterium]
MEQVLEYNRDPNYLRDLLLYRLTLEAQRRINASPPSKREIIRRLGTSAAQLYRLLDQTLQRTSGASLPPSAPLAAEFERQVASGLPGVGQNVRSGFHDPMIERGRGGADVLTPL